MAFNWFRRKPVRAIDWENEEIAWLYGEESIRENGGSPIKVIPRVKNLPTAGMSQSFSLKDMGKVMEDFDTRRYGRREGPGMAYAASNGGYDLPDGTDTTGKGNKKTKTSGEVPTLVIQGAPLPSQPPPLENPQTRVSRGGNAQQYYMNDGVAGPAVKTLYEFVIGPGMTIEVPYEFEEAPPWFDVNAPEVAAVKAKYAEEQAAKSLVPDPNVPGKPAPSTPPAKAGPGKKSKSRDLNIFKAYMKYRFEQLHDKLDLDYAAMEFARDALITGDAFGYRVDAVTDETYIDNITPDKEFLFNDIEEIQYLNPLAVSLEVDPFNTLVKATIRQQSPTGGGAGSAGTPIPDLTKLLRLKWGGAGWTVYGVSHMSNALTELSLKASLLAAAQASADRFAVPIMWAQFGLLMPGDQGGPMAPDSWRAQMEAAFQRWNRANGEAMIVPFHWDLRLIGAENGVVDLAGEIEACNRRIMMSLGIPPNFLDSNFTSFATAKIQFTNTILKLRQLQARAAKTIEEGILNAFSEMRGYRAPDGSLIKGRVVWHRGELESDPAIIALIGILAGNTAQRILSDKTIRETLGFSSENEDENFAIQDQAGAIRKQEFGLPDGTQVDEMGNPIPPAPASPTQSPLNQNKKPTVVKTPKKAGTNTNPTKAETS